VNPGFPSFGCGSAALGFWTLTSPNNFFSLKSIPRLKEAEDAMIRLSGLFFFSVFLLAADFDTSGAELMPTKVTMTTGSFSEREAGCAVSRTKRSTASKAEDPIDDRFVRKLEKEERF
jgi:hypothetical protein